MHVARVVELAHGGVDDGVAGEAGAPGLEGGGGVVPVDVGVFGFEGFVHARREGRGLVEKRVGGKGEERRGGKGTYQMKGQCARTCL